MYLFYRKSFDISRTRAGNVPRLSNVNLSTFGQWGLSQHLEEAPGYICTQDIDAGLKDLISYGLTELKKFEFTEIQENEVTNFQRGLAAEIRNVAERATSLIGTAAAQEAVRRGTDAISHVAARELIGFDASSVSCGFISNSGTFRDYGNAVVRAMSQHQRRQVPREFMDTERLYMARPAVGAVNLSGMPGYLNSSLESVVNSIALASITEDGDFALTSPQITVDYNPLNLRYVRYLQHLAHKYSPFRLRVTGSERDQAVYIQVVIDYGFMIDQYYQMYRPYMPECTIANPSIVQKALLSMLVASRFTLEPQERREIPDEYFVNPTPEGVTQAIGARVANSMALPTLKPCEELSKYSINITEALWSLSKLRGSALPSTSLDFPELTQFLQPTSSVQPTR